MKHDVYLKNIPLTKTKICNVYLDFFEVKCYKDSLCQVSTSIVISLKTIHQMTTEVLSFDFNARFS